MQNNFFTPQQISPSKRQPFSLNFKDTYDLSQLLHKDLFQMVCPHVQSISDQKRKIISWLKKIPLIERMDVLTYSNKQFTCLIRAMFQKKQHQFQPDSAITFTISYIHQNDQFDLMSFNNNKKLNKQYLDAQDELLSNVRIMSRYTQFDSITFSDHYLRNIDCIFSMFDILGNGIAHQLTQNDYQRLMKLPNSAMFYEPIQQNYKKCSIGTWIVQVFMKHISMKYFQYQLMSQDSFIKYNDLRERSKQFQRYWKLIPSQRKHQIIIKSFNKNTLEMFQQHRAMVKVTRNGFPIIGKSYKNQQLIGHILQATQKEIFQLLICTQLSQTLDSHTFFKYYIVVDLEEQIKKNNQLQQHFDKDDLKAKKMKKKKKKLQNNHKTIEKIEITQKIQKSQDQQNQIQQIQIKQQSTQTLKEVIIKGTHLFYKKLEISQTQQIISFDARNENIQSAQNKQHLNQQVIQIQKMKKKRKNKNKKKKNDKIQSLSQNLNRKQESLSVQKVQQTNSNRNVHKHEQQQKISQIKRKSQKQSQTTAGYRSQDQSIQKKEPIQNKKKPQQVIYDPFVPILVQLQKKNQFYQKQRKLITNRLSLILSSQDISFKLYGSSSCGLSLPTSDIDLVIDPSIVNYFYFSYSNYRKKIINSLQYIQKLFQQLYWTQDFLLLPAATIPLLTFNVNTNVSMQYGQINYNNINQINYNKNFSNTNQINSYNNYNNRNEFNQIKKYNNRNEDNHDKNQIHYKRNQINYNKNQINYDKSQIYYNKYQINHNKYQINHKKAEINHKKAQIEQNKYQNHNHFYNNKKQLKEDVWISIDITIEPYVNMTDQIPIHLGVESTQLMKDWMHIYPLYKQTLLLLKLLIKNHNLNKVYHGGISSFMQAVILTAFYKTCQSNSYQSQLNNKSQTSFTNISLLNIFKNYCVFIKSFNEQNQLMDINSSQTILTKSQQILANKLIIINPLTGEVMSQRCTTFLEYKEILNKVYQIIKSNNTKNIEEELNNMFFI